MGPLRRKAGLRCSTGDGHRFGDAGRMKRWILVPFLLAAAIGGFLVQQGYLALPPAWNPFGPPDLSSPPGPFFRMQIASLSKDGDACFALLREAGIEVDRLPDRRTEAGCGWEAAAQVSPGDLAYGRGFVAVCPLVAALAAFERHVVEPAAREHLGAGLARMDHLGSYACRNVYGRTAGRRSQHATANALDIAGFRLENGRTVTLDRDWGGSDEEARFLAAVRDGACDIFGGVLGPDYNAAHADHFHLDLGPYRICS